MSVSVRLRAGMARVLTLASFVSAAVPERTAVGDRRRFRVFADFVREQFPEAQSVLDVAGGRGVLAFELRERGLFPVTVDLRVLQVLPRRLRRILRKEALRTGRVPRLAKIARRFEDVDLSEFDLIAGLHPDQATEPLVRRAVAAGKPFAVVPCCVTPLDGLRRTFGEWVDCLIRLAPGSEIARLPFDGANTVIFGHPVTRKRRNRHEFNPI